MPSLHIEFISDYICPWCYLGKVRLDRIKKKLAGELELNIEVKPHVLYPHIPLAGEPKAYFATKTKPGMGRSLKAETAAEDISFNYKLIQRIPYSMHAHRLTWLIQDHAERYELSKLIFHRYFEMGQDIGDLDVLADIAESAGHPASLIERINQEQTIEAVDTYITQVKAEFISVVPTLKLNHQVVINGLQSDDLWERYFLRASRMK